MDTTNKLVVGGRYSWKGQPERLVYIGRNWSGNGYWHQFELVGRPGVVWCEVVDADLGKFEESKPADATQATQAVSEPVAPIDIVLHCPACGLQHIDAPENMAPKSQTELNAAWGAWTNPPHRSHLCHGCGHIWRPADVPTNGVAAVKTRGTNDSPSRVSVSEPVATQPAEAVAPLTWYDGEPPFPQNQEWFIAETIYGDRVVLTALPEGHTYDYKTADSTYMAAKNVKRWMQFPDCEYIPPDTHPTLASASEPLQAMADNERELGLDYGLGASVAGAGEALFAADFRRNVCPRGEQGCGWDTVARMCVADGCALAARPVTDGEAAVNVRLRFDSESGEWLGVEGDTRERIRSGEMAISADALWKNDALMAVNAELGLSMAALVKIANALARQAPAPLSQAVPEGDQ